VFSSHADDIMDWHTTTGDSYTQWKLFGERCMFVFRNCTLSKQLWNLK